MYNFVRVSRNKKTGPIPTTMTEQSSCPKTCPLKGNGCYAESGPTLLAWRKHTKYDLGHLTRMIKSLPQKQLWRHNVAGEILAGYKQENVEEAHHVLSQFRDQLESF